MRIGALFAVFIYTVLSICIGIWLVMLGIGSIGLESVRFPKEVLLFWINQLYANPTYQLYVMIAGIVLLFISFLFWIWTFSGPRRNRQVVFKGDSGEVSVNLASPIEAIVKDVARQNKEVIDVRQESYMWGRTLVIEVRTVMRPNVKIKEISEKMQEMIIERVREVIGLEGPIKVKVRVMKVLEPKKKSHDVREEEVPIPFRNMDV